MYYEASLMINAYTSNPSSDYKPVDASTFYEDVEGRVDIVLRKMFNLKSKIRKFMNAKPYLYEPKNEGKITQ